jgi:hypothetical protein
VYNRNSIPAATHFRADDVKLLLYRAYADPAKAAAQPEAVDEEISAQVEVPPDSLTELLELPTLYLDTHSGRLISLLARTLPSVMVFPPRTSLLVLLHSPQTVWAGRITVPLIRDRASPKESKNKHWFVADAQRYLM